MRMIHAAFAFGVLLSIIAWPRAGFGDENDDTQKMMAQMAELSRQLPAPGEELDPQMRKARAFIEKNKNLEALAILREVIKKRPDDPAAIFLAANAFLQIQRAASARTLLEQVLVDHPDNAGLLNNLAWIYATTESAELRNPSRALDLARRALILVPDNFHIWSTMSAAHFASRNYPRALRAAEVALRLSRENNASPSLIVSYEGQVAKSRKAVEAFSIIE